MSGGKTSLPRQRQLQHASNTRQWNKLLQEPETTAMSSEQDFHLSDGNYRTDQQTNFYVMETDSAAVQDVVAPCMDTDLEDPPNTTLCRDRIGHNMKLGNTTQCDTKSLKGGLFENNGSTSIVDTVHAITSGWKRQSESLAFTPVEALDFYKRQYKHLTTVLSIALFNDMPTTGRGDVSQSAKNPKQPNKGVENSKQNVGTKRKRNTIANNDIQYIVFEKSGKLMFRRVESAEKYAKRNKPKISSYLCIMPKSEDNIDSTKNFLSQLRSHYPTFLSGNTINFDGTIIQLCEELNDYAACFNLDESVLVKHVGDPDLEGTGGTEGSDNPSPAKKVKLRLKNVPKEEFGDIRLQKLVVKKNEDCVQPVDETHRSGIENETESEDSSSSEDEEHVMPVETFVNKQVEQVEQADTMNTVDLNLIVDHTPLIVNKAMLDRPPSPFLHDPQKDTANIVSSEGKKRKRTRIGGTSKMAFSRSDTAPL